MQSRMIRTTVLVGVLWLIAGLLLVGSAAQAQSPVTDQLQATVLTGGSYRLSTNAAQTTSGLTGAQYHLLPAAPTAGEGCCCKANLPCILK
jgi:hypothetical protein